MTGVMHYFVNLADLVSSWVWPGHVHIFGWVVLVVGWYLLLLAVEWAMKVRAWGLAYRVWRKE